MKVTALIPDQLVADVTTTAGGKNLTESLLIALREWLSLRKLEALHEQVAQSPLSLTQKVGATIRRTNRRHAAR